MTGHGTCECGECKCSETEEGQYSGKFCEDCPVKDFFTFQNNQNKSVFKIRWSILVK